MSHYTLEIIMPPQKDIKAAITTILAPFDENGEDPRQAFWDFWVIGGRWAGTKITQTLDAEKLKEFFDQLQKLEIQCHGFTSGKQEITTPQQVAIVDNVWSEMFPDHAGKCPIFKHSNDPYNSEDYLPGDIMFVKDITGQKADRIIFASAWYDALEAQFMLTQEIWNGVTHERTTWDGTISQAIERWNEKLETGKYSDKFKAGNTPQGEWICVTVDYHS